MRCALVDLKTYDTKPMTKAYTAGHVQMKLQWSALQFALDDISMASIINSMRDIQSCKPPYDKRRHTAQSDSC